jgi:hypothetical protein
VTEQALDALTLMGQSALPARLQLQQPGSCQAPFELEHEGPPQRCRWASASRSTP